MPRFWEVRGLKRLLGSGMLERRNVVAARAGAIGSGVARAGSGQSDGVGDGVQPTAHTPNDPVGHDSGVPRPIRRANASEHFFSGAPPFGGGTRAPRRGQHLLGASGSPTSSTRPQGTALEEVVATQSGRAVGEYPGRRLAAGGFVRRAVMTSGGRGVAVGGVGVVVGGVCGPAKVLGKAVRGVQGSSDLSAKSNRHAHGGGGCFREGVRGVVGLTVDGCEGGAIAEAFMTDVRNFSVGRHPNDRRTAIRSVEKSECGTPNTREWPLRRQSPGGAFADRVDAIETVRAVGGPMTGGTGRHEQSPGFGSCYRVDPRWRHAAGGGHRVAAAVDSDKRPTQASTSRKIRVQQRPVRVKRGQNGVCRGVPVPMEGALIGQIGGGDNRQGDKSVRNGAR